MKYFNLLTCRICLKNIQSNALILLNFIQDKACEITINKIITERNLNQSHI